MEDETEARSARELGRDAGLVRIGGAAVLVSIVAVVGIALSAAGLFARLRRGPGTARGWGVVGLLGTAMLATSLMITNGLETLGYLGLDLLRQNQELFWLLRHVTRTLFTTELTSWVLVFLGFSVAGWRSAAMPRWISILGCVSALGAMVSVDGGGRADHGPGGHGLVRLAGGSDAGAGREVTGLIRPRRISPAA